MTSQPNITTYEWVAPDYLVNNQGLMVTLEITEDPYEKKLTISEYTIYDQAAIGWLKEVLDEVLELT